MAAEAAGPFVATTFDAVILGVKKTGQGRCAQSLSRTAHARVDNSTEQGLSSQSGILPLVLLIRLRGLDIEYCIIYYRRRPLAPQGSRKVRYDSIPSNEKLINRSTETAGVATGWPALVPGMQLPSAVGRRFPPGVARCLCPCLYPRLILSPFSQVALMNYFFCPLIWMPCEDAFTAILWELRMEPLESSRIGFLAIQTILATLRKRVSWTNKVASLQLPTNKSFQFLRHFMMFTVKASKRSFHCMISMTYFPTILAFKLLRGGRHFTGFRISAITLSIGSTGSFFDSFEIYRNK